MAFNEQIAARIRALLEEGHHRTEEKLMFGGICFMVSGKMCAGVLQDRIMIRMDPAEYETALEEDGAGPMDFSGRIMKGFIFVDTDSVKNKSRLQWWLDKALAYNPNAKKAKQKKKAAKKTAVKRK